MIALNWETKCININGKLKKKLGRRINVVLNKFLDYKEFLKTYYVNNAFCYVEIFSAKHLLDQTPCVREAESFYFN